MSTIQHTRFQDDGSLSLRESGASKPDGQAAGVDVAMRPQCYCRSMASQG